MRSSYFLRNYLENTIRALPVLFLTSLRILQAFSKPEALDISWSSCPPPWSSKLYLGTVSVLLLMWWVDIASWIRGRMSTGPFRWMKEDNDKRGLTLEKSAQWVWMGGGHRAQPSVGVGGFYSKPLAQMSFWLVFPSRIQVLYRW